jgi:hypothetical protein
LDRADREPRFWNGRFWQILLQMSVAAIGEA